MLLKIAFLRWCMMIVVTSVEVTVFENMTTDLMVDVFSESLQGNAEQ